jgi:hypothetical protein
MLKIQRIELPVDFRRSPEVTRSLSIKMKSVLTKKKAREQKKGASYKNLSIFSFPSFIFPIEHILQTNIFLVF